MKKCIVALVAVAGTAGIAAAQGYQIQLVSSGGTSLTAGDTVTVTVQIGWFGEGGLGPRSFLGTISTDGGTLAAPAAVEPVNAFGAYPDSLGFTNGPTSGAGSTATSLNAVDWFRGAVFDVFAAGSPPAYGVDSYVDAGTFSYTYGGGASETITATSTSANILTYGAQPPQWLVSSSSATQTSTGTLTFVPAPGAVALLGLGGLVAGRRRR